MFSFFCAANMLLDNAPSQTPARPEKGEAGTHRTFLNSFPKADENPKSKNDVQSPVLSVVVQDCLTQKLAERVGFEPTVPFRARLISSQVR